MPTKKKMIIFLAAILLFLPIGLILFEWVFFGGGIKRIYYNHWRYDKNKVRVVEDDNFLFYRDGYSKIYTLNSSYYVAHRILLIPESKSVPIEFEYSGEIRIEIFDSNNNLLKSTLVNNFNVIWRKGNSDYYGNHLIYGGKQRRYASSVFAFELGTIPFDLVRLKWKRLKNMKIRITVIKPDKDLQKFCKSATLVIIPDLSL
jgi:hypothetical protein